MADGSAYDQVVDVARKYLKEHKKINADSAAPSKELVDYISRLKSSGQLDLAIESSTILQYISSAANHDASSGIVSGGRWGGYWFDDTATQPEAPKAFDTTKIKDKQGKQVTFSERDLYPLIEFWLSSIKGYTSKNVSNVKSGRKWGNPDIVGITLVQLFQAIEIEVSSVEVKLSADNWEQFIFEAISHKRFSNRSWYCYRVSDARSSLSDRMAYYAERYRIGIVQIYLTDEDMAILKANPADPIAFVDRVQELVLAVYDPVPLQEKKELIERAGITFKPTFK